MMSEREQFNPEGQYREVLGKFNESVNNLRQPLAHGTTSDNLVSILEKGLGIDLAGKPPVETASLTDLKQPDGLLGAYAFARVNSRDLAVKSEDITGKDIITRYAEINSLVDEQELREKFRVYREKKTQTGFPVVLVYESGSMQLEHVNPKIPSEVELNLKDKWWGDNPAIILVPDKQISVVQELLQEFEVYCKIFPIEALELD